VLAGSSMVSSGPLFFGGDYPLGKRRVNLARFGRDTLPTNRAGEGCLIDIRPSIKLTNLANENRLQIM